MGSPISSVIAQIIMEYLEVLEKVPFHIPFFYRYVNDCLTAVSKHQHQYILNLLNNTTKTIEIAKNNQINF